MLYAAEVVYLFLVLRCAQFFSLNESRLESCKAGWVGVSDGKERPEKIKYRSIKGR